MTDVPCGIIPERRAYHHETENNAEERDMVVDDNHEGSLEVSSTPLVPLPAITALSKKDEDEDKKTRSKVGSIVFVPIERFYDPKFIQRTHGKGFQGHAGQTKGKKKQWVKLPVGKVFACGM